MKYLKSVLVILLLPVCFVVDCLDIQSISDSTIDSTIGDGHGNWLLLFYLETCPHCKNAISVFNDLSQNPSLNNEESLKSLQIGKIECSMNNWSCMRFNITRVPYIVALQNGKLFEYNFYAIEDKLISFLKEEKLVESGLPIPPILGYAGILSKILEESARVLNEQMQMIVDTYLGIDLTWGSYHTIMLLISILFLMLFIEYLIVFYCCYRKKKKTVNTDNDTTNSSKYTSNSNTQDEQSEIPNPEDDKTKKD
jgi:hypothetical protein